MGVEDNRRTGMEPPDGSTFPDFLSDRDVGRESVVREDTSVVKIDSENPSGERTQLDDNFETFRLPRPYGVRVSHGVVGQVKRLLYNLFGP
ncbi:MAG: hypothetical protein A2868_03575 [Candidatus Levybacteria bacterium RIFCSPHIGHO2_01_FULL_40_15b]|nr:MAG: hypothetical protein A2868_03575 [Candidatus Levybacteria bacterium RIFCSPHIGHO2_01_FULL_40_15b]